MNYTIEVLGLCTRSNPLLSISPVSKDGSSGEELSYSIYLTNDDNIFCSPSTFSLTLNPLFNAGGWKFDRADWLSGWKYREIITIDNTQNPNTLTDYQVLATVDTVSLISAGKMNTDCSDMRFTDVDGSLINYWLESGCNSGNTKLWVKVPSIPAFSTKTIYAYYGNPSASSASNVTKTFDRIISNLKAAWHADEGSGSVLYDSSGNNHHISITPGAGSWTTDSKFGYAFDMSVGYNPVGTIQNVGGHTTFNPGTVVAWIKRTSNQRVQGLLDSSVPSRVSGTDWSLRIEQWDSTRKIGYTAYGVADYYWEYILPLGEWHQVVWQFTPSYAQLYVDGSFHSQHSRTARIPFNKLGGDDPWNDAILDDVFVFTSNLADLEISDINSKRGYATPNYPNNLLIRKYTSPEPTVKVGITLNPQETRTINLNVTSSLTAGIGTYSFNINTSSGIYSNSTSASYIISMACPPPNCKYLGQCFANGDCMGTLLKCDNGAQVSSCGDGSCNCGENELNCPTTTGGDCAGVYFKLYRNWNLISLPYKKVAEVTGDTCGQDKLYFYYWEGNTWKKTLGIKNIKGGYGYWVNPTWFTKVESCWINVTANVGEETTVQDIPQLLKGYNAIGAPYAGILVSQLTGCSMPIKLYWDAYNQKWVAATKLNSTIGYWVYVDNDCTLSI